MSGLNRPQAPRISTNVDARSASSPRSSSYANSPSNTRPLSAQSPVHPEQMHRKRPAESRSRGHSPPDKRVRPPERPPPMQDRYANAAHQSLVSPPPSRKPSLAALPDSVPTGPRNADGTKHSNPRRSANSSDAAENRMPNGVSRAREGLPSRRPSAGHSPLHRMSPGSTGSGGSTPVHGAAPLAPSMLPKAASASTGPETAVQSQQQDQISKARMPMTLDTVQKLRLRKLAIANEAKGKGEYPAPASSSTMSTQLEAQQLEIAQLKQEREQLSNKVKALESLPGQLEELTKRLNKTTEDSKKDSTILGRLAELEKLMFVPDKIKELEATTIKISADTKHITDLKRDINDLNVWKEAQSTSEARVEEKLKASILDVIASKLSDGADAAQKGIEATETRLTRRIDKQDKSLDSLEALRNIVNKDLPKVLALERKVRELEGDEQNTYDKTTKIQSWLDLYVGSDKEFDKHDQSLVVRVDKLATQCGQVQTIQSEQSKLSNELTRLIAGQDETSKEAKALAARVEKLEKKANAPGPGFIKVGNTVANSPNNATSGLPDALKQFGQLNKDVKELRQSLEGVQSSGTNMVEINQRFELVSQSSQKNGAATEQNTKAVEDLQKHLDQVATDVKQVQGEMEKMSGVLEDLDKGLTANEKMVHDHDARIKVVHEEVPALFRTYFDPFKQKIEQQLEQLGQAVNDSVQQVEDLKHLRQEVDQVQSMLKNEQAVNDSVQQAEDLKHLRQEVDQVQSTLKNEQAVRDQAIRLVKHEITQKAELATTNEQMERFSLAFRNLQEQYNNITTDDLHGRMVQWFLQNYPNSTANSLQQLSLLQQDVQRLQALSAQVSWIQTQSQNLADLLTNAPKLDEACKGASDAIAKAGVIETKVQEQRKLLESVQGAVDGLQQSFHNLNSATSPFVKVQAILDIERRFEALKAHVEGRLAGERQACVDLANELRSTSSQMTAGIEDIAKASSALRNLRNDVDTLNNDYIKPNRDFFGLFGNMVIAIGQLQSVVENLNQNLPKGPLAIEWNQAFEIYSGASNDQHAIMS